MKKVSSSISLNEKETFNRLTAMDRYQELILSVKLYPELWGENTGNECNQEDIRHKWDLVGVTQNPTVSGAVAFLRFKHLRDQFIAHYKLRGGQSALDNGRSTDWKYYEDLSFLEAHLNIKGIGSKSICTRKSVGKVQYDIQYPGPKDSISTNCIIEESRQSDGEFTPVEFEYIKPRFTGSGKKSEKKEEIIENVSSGDEVKRPSDVVSLYDSDSDWEESKESSRVKKRRRISKRLRTKKQLNPLKKIDCQNVDSHDDKENGDSEFLSTIDNLMKRVPGKFLSPCKLDIIKVINHYAHKEN